MSIKRFRSSTKIFNSIISYITIYVINKRRPFTSMYKINYPMTYILFVLKINCPITIRFKISCFISNFNLFSR